uniref:Uncharacterized protein n=1 Tax=Oryza glumipatula TaxID=40148 RepID=A0A0E0A698_9ORYZ
MASASSLEEEGGGYRIPAAGELLRAVGERSPPRSSSPCAAAITKVIAVCRQHLQGVGELPASGSGEPTSGSGELIRAATETRPWTSVDGQRRGHDDG